MLTEERGSGGQTRAERAQGILEETLALAEEVGWDDVRLRIVARRLGLSMAEIVACYRDLDAIADAWFARGRAAMLQPPADGFEALPARERLEQTMMAWFDALAPHRRVTVEMLTTKLWPVHVHHWVPMIFDLSRTILWVRDCAALDAGGVRRSVEEVGLTWLFLATLAVWSTDDSDGQQRTRRFLADRLREADALVALAFDSLPPVRATS